MLRVEVLRVVVMGGISAPLGERFHRQRAPLTLVTPLRGDAWVLPDEGEATSARPGDIVVLRGPGPYTVADDPATPPQTVILPGQRCVALSGEPLAQRMDLGVRTWGTSRDGACAILTGTYALRGAVGDRLLAALPPLLRVEAGKGDRALVALLAEEVGRDEPGQAAVLDRLLDLVLISTLRSWFSRPDAAAPGWYRAHADPIVGPALHLMHNAPARPWTVAALAAEIGVSRAGLGRRHRRGGARGGLREPVRA